MPIAVPKPEPVHARAIARLASEPALARSLDWLTAEKRWVNERHVELCRIAAPTFQEQRRADWMVAQFKAIGCDARIDKAGNVLAYPKPPQNDGPLVALTAHLDTVLEPLQPEDIRPGRDGQLQGPGVSDNGAGLAALLAIAQAIRTNGALLASPLPLVFIANVGEEGEGNLSGMRYICRPSGLGSRITSFVVLDGPAVEHITCRALASRRFEVSISGPGGHSWSDHGVGNPVHALSRVISVFCDNPVALGNGGGPRTSFNFGLIEGGTSVNSIPNLARTKVDLRSENPARLDELAALLTAAVEHALESENERAAAVFSAHAVSPGRVSAKIREIGSRPGGQLNPDAAILRHLRAIDAHLGIRAHLDCASTDANVPLSLGIPAVSIGAGGQGGGAHTPGEWFHPEGRDIGLRRIFLALCLLMRDLHPAAAANQE